jgi:hypothetical protein
MSVSDRIALLDGVLASAGCPAALVGIGREDDRPWAKFRVAEGGYVTYVGNGQSDAEAAADIVRQAAGSVRV